MEEHGLLSGPAAILEIAPWWSFARRLSRTPGIRYTSVDLDGSSAIVTHVGDITELPFDDRSMDAVICIHVLEHVEDDARAMSELHRVLRPGGWALVTVPINRNAPTDEDPLITDPEERKQRFGERSHVRMYGLDIVQRLATAGFEVTVHDPTEVDATERRLHGLKTDEFVFLCTRPVADPVGDPA